jgi:hypothetical protein
VAKDSVGEWYVQEKASHLMHTCIGLPPTAVRYSAKYLADIPAVKGVISALGTGVSAKHVHQAMDKAFGIAVPKSTVADLLCQRRRATKDMATQDLNGIGRLCQAFVNMNPGTVLELEVDSDGRFHRFYLCPGSHDSVLLSLLPINFSDAYHGKNKEFRFQIVGSVALTNQRTQFIHSVAIIPIEDKVHWTWYFTQVRRGALHIRVQSLPRLIFMGDREKGELAGAGTVFPEVNLAACTRHIGKNMQRLHIMRKKGDGLWLSVARAATREERDGLWNLLCSTSPKQAAFLQQIPATMWQTCEMLEAGCQTHFSATNNVAECLGSRLLSSDFGDIPIRYRTAGPMVRGLMEMMADQSRTLRHEAARIEREGIKYSDYAISLIHQETEQAEHYAAVMIGAREWVVRRKGLVTDKVRHVTFSQPAGLQCACQLRAECAVACRHIIAVCRVTPTLRHLVVDSPCSDLWLNSRFVEAFRDFHVRMPTSAEENSTVISGYPENIGLPLQIKPRGRPRVKRINIWGARRAKAGSGGCVARKCGVCSKAGHMRSKCPVRLQFKV